MPQSEIIRYVSYLQRSLANKDIPFVDQSAWVKLVIENADRLREIPSPPSLTAAEIEGHYLDLIAFQPETEFETASNAGIFRPLVEEISAIATELGIGLSQPVIAANLPDIGIGPVSRPSSENPMIFVGMGTSTFCNYWSKIYATFFSGLAIASDKKRPERSAEKALSQMPMLVLLTAKLCLYYAFTGTTMYFGQMKAPPSLHPLRAELLRAMELFVIAHEFAHLHFEEKYLFLQGNSDPNLIRKLEYECDKIALALCRNCGAKTENWSAFSGAGAFLFFEAVKISYYARDLIRPQTESDGHPSPTERQQALFDFAIESTHAEEQVAVKAYMEDLRSEISLFSEVICSLIESAVRDKE